MSLYASSNDNEKSAPAELMDLLKEVGPFALIGLLVALVFLALFAKLSEEVFSQEITTLDKNVSLWVHSFASPPLDFFFNALSTLGGPVGVGILTISALALLFFRHQARNAWRLIIVMAGGLLLNQVLKLLFHRSRPELWPGLHFAGFSFPSGHATMSLCLFGMFAWLGWVHLHNDALRISLVVLMVVLVFLVGLSRIYLGAHYLSDVVAGYLSAAVWLAAVLSGTDIYRRFREGTHPKPAPK